jgi:hypothetical protein
LGWHPVAVVQYTFTHKQYTEQHNNFGWKAFWNLNPDWSNQLGRVRAVLRLCELYPGICLTTEEKGRINLSHWTRYFHKLCMQFISLLHIVIKHEHKYCKLCTKLPKWGIIFVVIKIWLFYSGEKVYNVGFWVMVNYSLLIFDY